MIDSFKGEYRWLSNFWPCAVWLDGEVYSSVEAAYVASKTLDTSLRKKIQSMSKPGDTKRFGRSLQLRDDWDSVKVPIMLSLLRQKFSKGTLRSQLLSTGSKKLVEGNTWGDTFWGVCEGRGKNTLGKLLMQVRDELMEEGVSCG